MVLSKDRRAFYKHVEETNEIHSGKMTKSDLGLVTSALDYAGFETEVIKKTVNKIKRAKGPKNFFTKHNNDIEELYILP